VPFGGELAGIGSAIAWAATTTVMRPLAGRTLLWSSAIRMTISSLLIVLYGLPTGALDRALHAPIAVWGWLLGSLLSSLVLGDTLYFLASARIGVARALPIASSFPLLAGMGAVLILGEPLAVNLAGGSALRVAGIAAVVGARTSESQHFDGVGVGLACLAAVGWACSGLCLAPALELTDPVAANAVRFPLAMVLFGGIVLVRRPPWRLLPRHRPLALAAGVGTFAASLLYVTSVGAIGVARAVPLNAMAPIFSALLAARFLRERVTPRMLAGVVMSVSGSALLVL
jgi:drug/metabolite transporter (DMT)-like permease